MSKKVSEVVTLDALDPMNNNFIPTFSLAVLLLSTEFLVSISNICALERGYSSSGHWPVLFRTSCTTLLWFIGWM